MSHLHGRIERLEQMAGAAHIDADRLAVLAPDEREFYLALRKREVANPERFLRTLTDAELDRLIAVRVKIVGGSETDISKTDA